MSRSVNKASLIGYVGAEPEVRTTPGGTRVAKASLATSRSWKDKSGQDQEATEWHRLTFWGKLADIVEQYVHKGDRLYVEGRIEYSQTEDQQTGATRHWTEINVRELVMLGSPGGPSGGQNRRESATEASAGGQGTGDSSRGPLDEPDDGLPF
ncbi:MAG: single-stranded DNA-binding protein [Candidatus Longimicrobiales bacterium M2_2A_002]